MSDMARRNRRKYTPEQEADAVRMVHEVGNLSKVARDLDLTESSLHNWVKQAEIDAGRGPEGPLTSEEREELRRLRRQVHTLSPARRRRWGRARPRKGTAVVRKTRSLHRTGEECPLPGMGLFQRTFSLSLQRTGGSAWGATPVASGPRHWAQP